MSSQLLTANAGRAIGRVAKGGDDCEAGERLLWLRFGVVALEVAGGVLGAVEDESQQRGALVAFGEMAGRAVEDTSVAVGFYPGYVADDIARAADRIVEVFDVHGKQGAEIELVVCAFETVGLVAVDKGALAAEGGR